MLNCYSATLHSTFSVANIVTDSRPVTRIRQADALSFTQKLKPQ